MADSNKKRVPPREAGGTVVVLGAGASRAAGEAWGGQLPCLPPLNADFFTHLQRVVDRKYRTAPRDVMKDVVKLFGSNFRLTLEDYFTQLEFLIESVQVASRSPEVVGTSLKERRDHLMTGLGAVLESATMPIIRSKTGCTLHQHLVEKLRSSDTVISFNYDCLIDDALRRFGDDVWNPRWSYGFPADYDIEGVETWVPDKPAVSRRSSVRLLKIHGSVNWQLPTRPGKPIHLKSRLYKQNGTPKFSIIPPVWNKTSDQRSEEAKIYPHIWRSCARAIRNAVRIIVIGFSFGPTDLQAQSVFRLALDANKSLRLLVIATPSPETRRRVREVFDVPLADLDVLVRQFKDFKDLVDHLDDAMKLSM